MRSILSVWLQLLAYFIQLVISLCRKVAHHFLAWCWQLLNGLILMMTTGWVDKLAVLKWISLGCSFVLVYSGLSPMVIQSRRYWVLQASTALHLLMKRNPTSKMRWTYTRLQVLLSRMLSSTRSSLLNRRFTLTLLFMLILIPSWLLTQLVLWLSCTCIDCREGKWCWWHGRAWLLVYPCAYLLSIWLLSRPSSFLDQVISMSTNLFSRLADTRLWWEKHWWLVAALLYHGLCQFVRVFVRFEAVSARLRYHLLSDLLGMVCDFVLKHLILWFVSWFFWNILWSCFSMWWSFSCNKLDLNAIIGFSITVSVIWIILRSKLIILKFVGLICSWCDFRCDLICQRWISKYLSSGSAYSNGTWERLWVLCYSFTSW